MVFIMYKDKRWLFLCLWPDPPLDRMLPFYLLPVKTLDALNNWKGVYVCHFSALHS